MIPAGLLAEKMLYAAANVTNQEGHGHRTSEEFSVMKGCLLLQKSMYRFAGVLKLVVSTLEEGLAAWGCQRRPDRESGGQR